MRTAAANHLPPPIFWGVGGPTDWTPKALQLAEALTCFEDSLCPDCKVHSHLAFDPHNTGRFTVDDELLCVVCEATESFMDRDRDEWPGTKLRILRAEGL